jgi:hypothetical protein
VVDIVRAAEKPDVTLPGQLDVSDELHVGAAVNWYPLRGLKVRHDYSLAALIRSTKNHSGGSWADQEVISISNDTGLPALAPW